MFNSWYDRKLEKAQPISKLVEHFSAQGSEGIFAAETKELSFTADEWNKMNEKEQSDVLMNYRLAYLGNTMVNWCPKLGTVLANDEVSEGVSIRGGYPVEQKLMYQWCLRVSAYAQRLLDGLDRLEWSDSIKETQRNWIGRSEGAEMKFKVADSDIELEIFTTRADTVFGVTFMVLAPESAYVQQVTTAEQKAAVDEYIASIKHKTERERMIDKKVSGVFTGAYAVNPLSGKQIPIWVSDYVLAGYGTGAIMAVPAHDSRDYAFAKAFNLPIIPLIEGADVSEESFDAKEGKMTNSEGQELNLNGLEVKEAIAATKKFIEKKGIGKVKVNYRLRDAIFSRQRYWGEPFPVYYKEGIPHMLDEKNLPLLLPEIETYKPTETGEPPLGRAKNWKTEEGYPLELCTMPGFAGSSAYYLRYMDPHNDNALVSKEANDYWRNVDLYIGGTEHATGHLIYSRYWDKFLYDLGVICEDEPFKKLVNQGMIQGRSNFVYRIKDTNTFVSLGLKDKYDVTPIHVDVNIVSNDVLDLEKFKNWRPEFNNAEFILEDGKYVCGYAVEKMSKSMFNVVNPDDIVEQYGADTLRLYEMFLGPLEQSKPWDTNGIDGVNRFIKKMWGLYYKGDNLLVDDSKPTADNLKTLHKLIKKVTGDIETFSFNTSVAAFMICVNELTAQKCHSREVLADLLVVIAPFAPHVAEELWHVALGNTGTICDAQWPAFNEEYLKESTANYAVSFNGKTRFNMAIAADASKEEVEKAALAHESAARWIEGKQIRKVIVVPGKIVNIVVG
jgi:leucyl-tRNA synthetase